MKDSIKSLDKYIGKKIRGIRTSKTMTSEELAEKTNTAHGTIRNIESGASLSLSLLLSIANALEVSPNDLLYDYIIHKPAPDIDPSMLDLFIDTYTNCDKKHQETLIGILKSFHSFTT